MQEVSASQQLKFMANNIDVSHTVFTFQSGIGNGMRILWDSRYLNVVGVKKSRMAGSGIEDFYEVTADEFKSST